MDYSKTLMHAKIADILKKSKVSTKEKELIHNAYHILIKEYIEQEAVCEKLEANNRLLELKYKELLELIETDDIKILN